MSDPSAPHIACDPHVVAEVTSGFHQSLYAFPTVPDGPTGGVKIYFMSDGTVRWFVAEVQSP